MQSFRRQKYKHILKLPNNLGHFYSKKMNFVFICALMKHYQAKRCIFPVLEYILLVYSSHNNLEDSLFADSVFPARKLGTAWHGEGNLVRIFTNYLRYLFASLYPAKFILNLILLPKKPSVWLETVMMLSFSNK